MWWGVKASTYLEVLEIKDWFSRNAKQKDHPFTLSSLKMRLKSKTYIPYGNK
jgi:hypothetical protein